LPQALWIYPSLYSKVSHDPLKDFTAIRLFAQIANILVLHPSLPIKTPKELMDSHSQKGGQVSSTSSLPATAVQHT
jgi:tripartite-type tricarboxylate transporter receptor subunit TctC